MWGEASEGSGRALNASLDSFAKITGNTQLSRAPLFLVGNSQGGIFAYSFATWEPERTLGFASIKGGFHDVEAAPRAFQVPGLFFIGQLDVPFRIRNIEDTFSNGRSVGAPWCLAIEPNSKHDSEPCSPLIISFFQAIANTLPFKTTQGNNTNQVNTPLPSKIRATAVTSWFPNPSFEKQWQLFQALGASPTAARLSFQGKLPHAFDFGMPEINLTSVSFDKQSSLIPLNIRYDKLKQWDGANILSRDYLSDIVQHKTSKGTNFLFRFNPANLPLGQFHGDIPVRYSLRGKPVLGGLNVPLSVKIVGDLVSEPQSIYLGPVSPDQTIYRNLKITSNSRNPVRFVSCDEPGEVHVASSNNDSSQLLITFSFNFSDKDVGKFNPGSGVILLHLSTDRPWVLRIPYIAFVGGKK
jgi:hypothetical protein